jgi:MFS transporter, DHA2 family, multidrug resistance protein
MTLPPSGRPTVEPSVETVEMNASDSETTAPVEEAAPKARPRDWLGLAVIALPCLLYSMDLTVLNLAVPALSADLRPSGSQLLWIIDIYGFFVAGSLITMGTLGDRIGRRRLLLIGAAAFGAGSVLAAFSASAAMLIATRALLGVAGATLAPSTLSLIRNMFHHPAQRTLAIGIWISSYSAGAAIGPLIGGVLLEHFRWGSVFLIGVPVMGLLLVLGPVLLPEFRDPRAGRLDLLSAGLSLISVLTMIYGLKGIAVSGRPWPSVLFVLVGLGLALVFVRRQAALADPLIDLRLFRAPAFTAAVATYSLGTFVAFGIYIFVGQYLQLVLGLSPLHAGLSTAPFALGFIVGSLLTPVIVRRVHPTVAITAGLGLAAVGFGLLTQVGSSSGLPVLVTGLIVYSVGLAPVFTLSNDVIIGIAPPERAGAAAALSETGSELGGALGIAVLGSIGAAFYRGKLIDGAPPGIPGEALAAARDTLAAALAVGEKLPGKLGLELVAAAREAFTSSLRLTALVSAVIVLGLAIATARFLRPAASTSRKMAPPGDVEPSAE